MKRRSKNLFLLIAFLAVLIIGYFSLDYLPVSTGEEEQDSVSEAIEITEFSPEDIVSYSYENSDYAIGFDITENGYSNRADAGFPVNTDTVVSQLSKLGNLTALQLVDSTDMAEYGLDSPRVTITVTLSDGTNRSFLIGDSALFELADYLLDRENNIIYLVSQSLATAFTCSWSNLIQKEEMTKITADQIVDVSVETDELKTMYITFDEAKENPWQLTTPEGTFDGDSTAVSDALGIFSSYALKNTVEYNCTDFSKYGLATPETVVKVRYKESGETEEPEVKTLVFEFGNPNEEASENYVRINGSSYVYTMTDYYKGRISVFDPEELKYRQEDDSEL